ncbi:MAG: calcium-binding protein, partial [Rhodospirillales bacterium]
AGASAGTLNIDGNLTAKSGAFEVELGGTGTAPRQSDLIAVSGAADLQGVQVEFTLIGGYQPLGGDQIVILSTIGGVTLDPSRLSLAIAGVGDGFFSGDFSVDVVGNDLVFAASEDIVTGNRAFFLGSDLDDNYTGGDGNDDLRGKAGDDTFTGGLGNDFIDGGAGAGDRAVFAGSVSEFSFAPGGPGETIVTDTNLLDGNQGSDTLTNVEVLVFDDFEGTLADIAATTFGTTGADALTGTPGNDIIFALAGDDTVTGGLGDDTINGGAGADTFVIAETGDVLSPGDVITDFEDGVDKIGLAGGLSFGDLFIAGNGAGGTDISIGSDAGETLAVLDGIDSSLLDQTDFTLVA